MMLAVNTSKSKELIVSGSLRQAGELFLLVLTVLSLLFLSRLESRFFELGEQLTGKFAALTSVGYFALINLNVFLSIGLAFLIFRNVAKLIVERRSGVLGSSLKVKLLACFVFFASAPTVLMFYVSTSFISEGFNSWLNQRVHLSLVQARLAASGVYDSDRKKLVESILLERGKFELIFPDTAYPGAIPKIQRAVDRVNQSSKFFTTKAISTLGTISWSDTNDPLQMEDLHEIASVFYEKKDESYVHTDVIYRSDFDVVRAIVPLWSPSDHQLAGMIVLERQFDAKVVRSIESILSEIASIKPGAEIIRLSFISVLVLLVVIILFSATWFGFYLARSLTVPLQQLAAATSAISQGDFDLNLKRLASDEMGTLVDSFQHMARKIQRHSIEQEAKALQLESLNGELRKRRDYLEKVLDAMTAGVLTLDQHGKIVTINDAALRLLGFTDYRVVGFRFEDLIANQSFERLRSFLNEASLNQVVSKDEVDLSEVGLSSALAVVAGTLELASGQGILLVLDDAAERARTQRYFLWKDVARRIAHEIKNPLTPIKLSAQRLEKRFLHQMEGENLEVFRMCSQTIISQVDSLGRLVSEFSDFARLPSASPKKHNLKVFLTEVLSEIGLAFPAIEATLDCSSEIESMLDGEQFKRIFVNLAQNAIQANSRVKTVLKIIVQRKVSNLEIRFVDDSSGISRASWDRVFDPYFSTRPSGTGLGLAIVKQIIEEHGGTVKVEDSNSSGTTFLMVLPYVGGKNV